VTLLLLLAAQAVGSVPAEQIVLGPSNRLLVRFKIKF
jgi:hypothetical protein